MLKKLVFPVLIGVAAAVSSVTADAQVRIEEKNRVRFEGALGKMAGMFGGGGAQDGIVTTTVVVGDRKKTVTESSGQIIDLASEEILNLDFDRKEYTVVTFDEMRRQMQEARARAGSGTAERPDGQVGEAPEYEIDVSVEPTGETRTINSFDTREIAMTLTLRQKGKTLEEGGGFVVSSRSWVTDQAEAMQQIAAFDRRYAAVLGEMFGMPVSAEQMAGAMAMFPALQEAMVKFEAEREGLDGTPVQTTVTFTSVADPAAADAPEADAAPSVGGLLGRIGRGLGRGNQKPAEGGGRTPILTVENETVKVDTDVSAADVAVPADFSRR